MAQSSLTTLLLEQLEIGYDYLKPLYEKALRQDLTQKSISETISSPVFQHITDKVETEIMKLQSTSRTAKLWINYIGYVEIAVSSPRIGCRIGSYRHFPK